MTKEEAKKRIEKLRKVINYHRYLYHVLDRQEISPDVLDSLKHELYKLEQQFPELITPDSPTQRIGGKPLDKFKKVTHLVPMLSLEDIFNEKELYEWEEYIKKLEPSAQFEYFCELKIDGFAITLIYENGLFVCGATRGDGKVGEDVTQNLRTIESIPLRLHVFGKLPNKTIETNLKKLIKTGRIEIRGEVYMDKSAFEKVNKERKKKGEPPYANPRNLAAGSIRQLDPKLAASRELKFLAYDIVTDVGQTKHSEEHQILPRIGFKTDPGKICKNLKEIVEFWKEAAKKRETLSFQIDGVVVSINNNDLFDKLGVAGKSPRGARALKFSPKRATTKIKDIKIQIGRTGAVTPVAILEPVEVGGVTITRATLHNEDEIKRLGVKIGDTVVVERAGDVIPAISKVLPELRTGKEKEFRMPRSCPVCGAKLIKPQGEVIWRCPNPDCSAKKREFLYHFVSKKAFNIEGLGPKIIDQLIEENLITEPPDIFELKEGDLVPLERFAEKSASNTISAIKNSKKIPLARFIYALGIRHVGEETAIDLANHFGRLERLKKASIEELEALPDVGPIVAKSIYEWFNNKRNLNLLKRFKEVGIEISPPPKIGTKLKGKTFAITGTLESMTRLEAQRKIRLLGGNPVNSISKNTNYLIVGKNPGSKLKKAKELGVKIITEEEFLKMITNNN
jgi:DNA ligase (NAD+)